jgi:hypothetical protein
VFVAGPPALWLVERRFGRPPRGDSEPAARLLLGLVPLAVIVIGVLEKLVGIDVGINLRANEDFAFFGALGVALILPVVVSTVIAFVRRRADFRRLTLAAAIPVFALELAAVYEYNDWIGRFMLVPVALSVPLLAAVYPARKLAAASVVLAVTGCFAAVGFNELKPVGLHGTTPVWSMSRVGVETLSRPRMRPIIDLVQARVPQRVRLGLVAGQDDWSYPFYGSSLERRVVYLKAKGALASAERQGIDEVLFARDRKPRQMPGRWRLTADPRSGWILARRA